MSEEKIPSRETHIQAFLKKIGWETAERETIANDASFRRYERLILRKKDGEVQNAILMDAPFPENPAQFMVVDKLLARAGVRVPKIYFRDIRKGLLLLEDLGIMSYSTIIKTGSTATVKLYKMAIDSLVKVQQKCHPKEGVLPLYSQSKMMEEVFLFIEWYVEYALHQTLSMSEVSKFLEIWDALLTRIQQMPKTVVLLDFHADNLLLSLSDTKCALLDFQDARIGPAHYDLISLLEDARLVVEPTVKKRILSYYFDQMPEFNTPEFLQTMTVMAAQRHMKVIGIFTRLSVRDHKDKYLKHIPFVWSLLEDCLEREPLLQPLAQWLDDVAPRHKRFMTLESKWLYSNQPSRL